MAESYLRRLDVGYPPNQPNPRGIYATRFFEDSDPVALQNAVNQYLLDLPEATAAWTPHLVSTQFGFYVLGSGPMPRERHTCWLTLFAVGTVTASPAVII